MNKITVNQKADPVRYGDLFRGADSVYLVTNPDAPKMIAALVDLDSGTSIAMGTLEDLSLYIQKNKLVKLPIGSTIVLTVK